MGAQDMEEKMKLILTLSLSSITECYMERK
jgi:hypothetical protein